MKLSDADKIRFTVERDALVDACQDLLWGSDVFRELTMGQVPMGVGELPDGDHTDDQVNAHMDACAEIQGEMIIATVIALLQRNNNMS